MQRGTGAADDSGSDGNGNGNGLENLTGRIRLNRRMLAELAANEPFSFKAVVDVVKMRAPPGFLKETP